MSFRISPASAAASTSRCMVCGTAPETRANKAELLA